MAKWTKWRKIAKKNDFYDGKLDHDGISCYELGLKAPDGKTIVRVYIGCTKNENNRIWRYAYDGSHLHRQIDKILKYGFVLYYRGQAKNTKRQARNFEKRLLGQRYYAWNKQLR